MSMWKSQPPNQLPRNETTLQHSLTYGSAPVFIKTPVSLHQVLRNENKVVEWYGVYINVHNTCKIVEERIMSKMTDMHEEKMKRCNKNEEPNISSRDWHLSKSIGGMGGIHRNRTESMRGGAKEVGEGGGREKVEEGEKGKGEARQGRNEGRECKKAKQVVRDSWRPKPKFVPV
ncbi:hypothetical protein FRC18_008453 [Serendipita sp. 400]|nr:hypothetical protein FRC18_008453 [Serendipita sp. 400]